MAPDVDTRRFRDHGSVGPLPLLARKCRFMVSDIKIAGAGRCNGA
jgi:hypothetical protein